MNLKCVSTYIYYINAPGGWDCDYITVGNVYEIISERSGNYEILHDHGNKTSEFPPYLFDPTEEPVTINPNREKEVQEATEKQKQLSKEREETQRQESIRDAMEKYYVPDAYYKRKSREERFRSAISEIFVQGISY
jgi:hypothetical protein